MRESESKLPPPANPVDGELSQPRGPTARAEGPRFALKIPGSHMSKTPSPRRRHLARVARLLVCLVAVAAVWACGPVFIPVPPPMQTRFMSELLIDSTGAQRQFWIAAGGPDEHARNATFFIIDQERNAGVIAGAMPDGSYVSPPMEGAEGDRILIYYRDSQARYSPTACLLLSEKPQPDSCP